MFHRGSPHVIASADGAGVAAGDRTRRDRARPLMVSSGRLSRELTDHS